MRSRRKFALILFGVMSAFLCIGAVIAVFVLPTVDGLLALGEIDSFYDCSTEDIENIGRMELPPSTENQIINCFLPMELPDLRQWETGITGKFDMSPNDLDTFLESTLFELPLATEGEPTRVSRWYRLDEIASYLYGKHSQDDYFAEILIDASNPDVYTVYIEVLGG